MSSPKYPGVCVQLSGRDGNAISVIGAVSAALRRQVGAEAAGEFTLAAFDCASYDELLELAMSTVEVS